MVRGCDDNSRESGNAWTPLQQILPWLWVPQRAPRAGTRHERGAMKSV
jgi:hypothetical protein